MDQNTIKIAILSKLKLYENFTDIDMHAVPCAKSCPTLYDLMDCSPPWSSANGIFQTRILEGAAISYSRESSQPKDRTHVKSPALAGGFFTTESPGKPQRWVYGKLKYVQ